MRISSNHAATDLFSEPEFVSVHLFNRLTTKIAINSLFQFSYEKFLLHSVLFWHHASLKKLLYYLFLCLFMLSYLLHSVSCDLADTANFQRNLSPILLMMENSHAENIIHRLSHPVQRLKRASFSDRRPLSSQLISFICYQLSEPCERVAFLRLHAYHDFCGSAFPLLYFLPHIADLVTVPAMKSLSSSPCRGDSSGLRLQFTDGLYTNFLHTAELCKSSLETLDTIIGTNISKDVITFSHLLSRSFCYLTDRPTNRTGDFDCQMCQQAYLSWVCSVTFPIFYPVSYLPAPNPPYTVPEAHLNYSSSRDNIPDILPRASSSDPDDRRTDIDSLASYKLISIPACQSWCTYVETLCPYLNPEDSTSNGGEPTFLCDESHYHFSPITDGRISNMCQHECCYTVEDLTSSSFDVRADDHRPESMPLVSSDSEGNCFSLATRCFHMNLYTTASSYSELNYTSHVAHASSPSEDPLQFSTVQRVSQSSSKLDHRTYLLIFSFFYHTYFHKLFSDLL